ncbi:Protein ssh4 [Dimargaris xerosporica]|nr:Protein ssh4 [Dimargaris xerosporica]
MERPSDSDINELLIVAIAVASAVTFLGAVLLLVFLPRLPRWMSYLLCCCHCICCPAGIRRHCRALLDESYAYGGYYGDGNDDDEFYVPDELRQSLFQNDAFRQSYELGRAFEAAHPYGSVATAITPEQQQMIMEKGVAAWQFELSPDINCMPQMEDRTELIFYGGENCVQTNLPIPKQNPVYYFEVKLQEKPQETNVAIGLATKPYPSWRLTGWNKHSVGYHADSGRVYHNNPFRGVNLGEVCFEGDIIGVGYQPRSGTVFFTRNGRRYKSVTSGVLYDLFPTVSADGYCVLSANFGQRGFVFIEANVKRWGLAPLEGNLCPPPMYGHDQDTFLVETAPQHAVMPADPSSSATARVASGSHRLPPPLLVDVESSEPSDPHAHQAMMERGAQAFAQLRTSPGLDLYRTASHHELPTHPSSPARRSPRSTELISMEDSFFHSPSSQRSPAAQTPLRRHASLASNEVTNPKLNVHFKSNNTANIIVHVPPARFRQTSTHTSPSPLSPSVRWTPHIDIALPVPSPPAYAERDPHPDAPRAEVTADDLFAQAEHDIAAALVPNPSFVPTLPSPPAYSHSSSAQPSRPPSPSSSAGSLEAQPLLHRSP